MDVITDRFGNLPRITKNEVKNYNKYENKSFFYSPEAEYIYTLYIYKSCSKCGIKKSLTEFGFNTSGGDPFYSSRNNEFPGLRLRRPECKTCNKKILKTKKLAVKEVKDRNISKGTNCEVCSKKTDNLVLDHEHKTGKFRGFLCNECNIILGKVNDDPKRLLKLAEYIVNY